MRRKVHSCPPKSSLPPHRREMRDLFSLRPHLVWPISPLKKVYRKLTSPASHPQSPT
ncbi:hypothetical protein USDA257_c17250 [Sinorhizobium fredii USDA 257]|uniref:Uncharacterized protein n=1 Tax=Sinorhizobium fredii (strain USDA 257) TaxID=1185652 RepID=I3X357_SINF2|nr:hypothetical protein USDA257_c17250 [Sinorhizobium fredii USDA 257]